MGTIRPFKTLNLSDHVVDIADGDREWVVPVQDQRLLAFEGDGGGQVHSFRYLRGGRLRVGRLLYLDGKSPEDNSTYVSLFVALASEGTDVRALFELTLMDRSGKERHKVHTHFGRALDSGPYALKYRGSMWGYKRFFIRTLLETSDYLKYDSLLIRCCVGVVKLHTEAPKTYSIAVPPSDI